MASLETSEPQAGVWHSLPRLSLAPFLTDSVPRGETKAWTSAVLPGQATEQAPCRVPFLRKGRVPRARTSSPAQPLFCIPGDLRIRKPVHEAGCVVWASPWLFLGLVLSIWITRGSEVTICK